MIISNIRGLGSRDLARVPRVLWFLALLAFWPGLALAEGQPEIRVALYQGAGTGGAGPTNLMKLLQAPPRFSIHQTSAEQIQSGALSNYNVVIFAGGSASKQAETLGETGRDAVRRFVGAGGGYIGICAGAYLATSKFSWGLRIIDAQTISPKWQRGRGQVKLELTPAARGILPPHSGACDILYVNGPIVEPAGEEDLPDYQTLALFRTELARNGTPAGIMVNSPAIFAAAYKQGRVLCVSPHPEQTRGLEDIVLGAVNWVAQAGNEAPLPRRQNASQ